MMHLVNEIARNVNRPVFYSKHLKKRLKERKISEQEMVKTLITGSVEVGGFGHFRVESRNCLVIVKLVEKGHLVVVTAFRPTRLGKNNV